MAIDGLGVIYYQALLVGIGVAHVAVFVTVCLVEAYKERQRRADPGRYFSSGSVPASPAVAAFWADVFRSEIANSEAGE